MAGNGFEILEMFVQGKRADAVCEDMVRVAGSYVVVLDGVTGKDGSRYRSTTGGRFAAEVVMDALAHMPGDATARACVDAVTAALRAAIAEETGGGSVARPPGTQLAVYSPHRRELWCVGDIHARIGGTELALKAPPTDAVATSFRAAFLSALLLDGASEEELIADDPSWEVLLPLLSRQDVFANLAGRNDYGYGVINGTAVPDHHLHVHAVPAGSEVVLATDGYLGAGGTLEQAEERLATALTQDRLMIRLHQGFRPAPKDGSFDDRGWVRFVTR